MLMNSNTNQNTYCLVRQNDGLLRQNKSDNDKRMTHTQAHTHTHTHTHTHARTHAHTRAHTHAHTHRRIHTHTPTHTHARTHVCTHTHAHTHACAHTHTVTHTHTYTHTHTVVTSSKCSRVSFIPQGRLSRRKRLTIKLMDLYVNNRLNAASRKVHGTACREME